MSLSFAAGATDYGTAIVEKITSVYDAYTFRSDIQDWPTIVGEHMSIRVAGIGAPEICPVSQNPHC